MYAAGGVWEGETERELGGREGEVVETVLRLIYDWPGTYFDNALRKWKWK